MEKKLILLMFLVMGTLQAKDINDFICKVSWPTVSVIKTESTVDYEKGAQVVTTISKKYVVPAAEFYCRRWQKKACSVFASDDDSLCSSKNGCNHPAVTNFAERKFRAMAREVVSQQAEGSTEDAKKRIVDDLWAQVKSAVKVGCASNDKCLVFRRDYISFIEYAE